MPVEDRSFAPSWASSGRKAWLWVLLSIASSAAYAQSGAAIRLTAYNADGTNTGTARLTAMVTVNAVVTGSTDQRLLWSVTGAGSISTSGVYQAPDTMPASAAVTITATLRANQSVSASYPAMLENAVPLIYNTYVQNGYLQTGITNTITVHGAGFVPGSVARVNGSAVPTAYQSSGYLLATVAVPVGATAPLVMTIVNAAPGGGVSPAFSANVVTPKLWLSAISAEGTNLGTARLNEAVSLVPSVSGTTSAAVNWSLAGAGSLSAAGVYQAPSTMPASTGVTITATLQTNPSISTICKLSLYSAAPVIYNAYVLNGSILSGAANALTIHGAGFTPSSVVLIDSVRVPVVYESEGYLLAQAPVAAGRSGTMAVVVQTAPSVNSSLAFLAPIAKIWLAVAAMADSQINPASLPIGGALAFTSQLQGSGSTAPLPVVWSVVGAGTISTDGHYQAPDAMTASPDVQVYATAAMNPAIVTGYHFYLVDAPPVILGSNPAQLAAGAANIVTIYGNHLVAGTSLTLNGATVPATLGTTTSLLATLNVPAQQTAPMSVVLRNPNPNTAASAAFAIPIAGSASSLSVQVGLTPGVTVPQDFLGLSHEWTDPEWLIGDSAVGTNQAYVQLLSNLMLGTPHALSIRMGGGSTDTTGEPSVGLGTTLAQLGATLPIHYSLGINLGANNLQLATDQASFLLGALPAGSVQALEIGNEPDEYVWNGLRTPGYSLATYLSDFAKWQAALAPLHPSSVTLMGPAWGETQTLKNNLGGFEAQESQAVGIVSQHIYAGYQETQPYFPPDYLLSPASAQGGPTAMISGIGQAHMAHQLFRIGEINSLDGGGLAGVSDTFSAALWSIDTMFRYASAGADGVNWHGLSGCVYCPFTFSVQSASSPRTYTLTHTNPLYYGWLFFQSATLNGARLLPVSASLNPNVSVWATIDPGGTVRVAIVNKDKQFAGPITISVAGYGVATEGQLLAPSYTSTSGVTLFGQTFDGSQDGVIKGQVVVAKVFPVNGTYSLVLAPVSATLLTLSH